MLHIIHATQLIIDGPITKIICDILNSHVEISLLSFRKKCRYIFLLNIFLSNCLMIQRYIYWSTWIWASTRYFAPFRSGQWKQLWSSIFHFLSFLWNLFMNLTCKEFNFECPIILFLLLIWIVCRKLITETLK